MQEQYNDPTDLRPEGKRLLDAPLVEIDLKKFAAQLKDEKTWKTSDRNAITVFKTPGMSVVLVALHKGAVMQKHRAKGIISVQVLEGHIRFGTDDQTTDLPEGTMVTLHKDVEHSVTALEPAVFLLTIAG